MKFQEWVADSGLTQRALAKRLRTSQGYVSDLVIGRRWPNREMYERIYKLTEGRVTPNDFFPQIVTSKACGRSSR